MNPIRSDVIEWIRSVSEHRPELNGFAVCPYASKSKFEIIECKVKEIQPMEGYDVIIFVVENDFSLNEVQKWVDHYNEKHQNWLFFEDCKDYDTFISGIKTNNGKYNLILGQPKEKLRNFREKLAKTGYYDHWEKEYLEEILGEDINLLNSRDSNPVKSSDLL
jgi:hypothetical protein